MPKKPTIKSFALQGIVHNLSSIDVSDGQAEDIVNLRFKDGSWRTSGDGKSVFIDNYHYAQCYIHTNSSYRHLLGVRDGSLYWFANISTDGVFAALDTAVLLTSVTGSVSIVQAGHLITIVDGANGFEYFVYKTGTNSYIQVKVDANGASTDRTIFPFGSVHFNISRENIKRIDEESDNSIDLNALDGDYDPNHDLMKSTFPHDMHLDKRISLFGKMDALNKFSRPFFVCAAIKLYDGSFMYASNPCLIYPNEKANFGHTHELWGKKYYLDGQEYKFESKNGYVNGFDIANSLVVPNASIPTYAGDQEADVFVCGNLGLEQSSPSNIYKCANRPTFAAGVVLNAASLGGIATLTRLSHFKYSLQGFDLACQIDSIVQVLHDNKDVFQSLCIFVTPQAEIYYSDDKPTADTTIEEDTYLNYGWLSGTNAFYAYMPPYRKDEEIIYDLTHSNFFLLKEYTANTINELDNNPIINLSSAEDKGVLTNIVYQQRLTYEAFDRRTYLPKVVYNYNGRLHIANYQSELFHGYPVEWFMHNNHSVDSSMNKFAFPSTLSTYDDSQKMEYYQWIRGVQTIDNTDSKFSNRKGFFIARVTIETQQGDKVVCRYIPISSDTITFEALDPLITYPDARAKKIELFYPSEAGQDIGYQYKSLTLKPHPYLNIAYYISSDLQPIVLSSFSGIRINSDDVHNALIAETNTKESFPNGLKVSSVLSPMVFPVEQTYQVGTSEVVALMSNAIAVGTGQTGAAPLYVFCKDGIYGMFVDSSGSLAYATSRILARDVCNNAKSVTPIDAGVVFTTDRGLMLIAGEKVKEIGQPMEGDYAHYNDSTHVNYMKIADNAYKFPLLANIDTTTHIAEDFLTYLKGSIITYNHNEYELMVSNPTKEYTLVRDNYGNWSRRDYVAAQYINDYPTCYRVDGIGRYYKIDEQSDDANGFFVMTNAIKLNYVGFKSIKRVVARGYFDTSHTGIGADRYIGLYVFGSYDGIKFGLLGRRERQGKFANIGANVAHADCRFFRFVLAGYSNADSRLVYFEIETTNSELDSRPR